MASLSEFDSIYRAIKRIFRQAKITDGNKNKSSGFTLLEILIALFIFAILALLLSNALHNVIGVQSRTEQNAERLHDTQIALVMMLRDISQAVNRPVMTAGGKDEVAFVGRPDGFTFTHMGITNADGKFLRSDMQRARYFVDGKTLWRYTWPVLDQAPNTIPAKRILLNDLEEASFEYLDSKHVFHSEWPLQEVREILPRAVKVTLTIAKWGKLTQLYLIPAEPVAAATNQQPAKTDGKSNDKTSDKSNEKTPPNKP